MTFFIVLLSIGGFLSTLTHGPVNHKNYCGGGRNHSTGYWTFTTYLLLKVCEFVSLWVANMVLYRKSCIRYNHKKRFAGLKKKWCSGACYCYYLPYYSSDLKVILSISLPTTIALLYYFSFGFLNSLTIIFDLSLFGHCVLCGIFFIVLSFSQSFHLKIKLLAATRCANFALKQKILRKIF